MIGQELRRLQAALDGKADALQHEFGTVGEQLRDVSHRLAEAPPEERAALAAEQQALRERQQALADEINLWRDRAHGVLRQPGPEALHAYLAALAAVDDAPLRAAAEHVLHVLDTPEEDLARASQAQAQARPTTPVGRLVERARTEYDLRGADPAPRRRAVFEFANRSGMAQNEEALAELEAALDDRDPLVVEILASTLIQIYRFRAMNLASLDDAHAAVERLARFKQADAVPVLIEVLATPRTGFTREQGQMVAGDNQRTRLVALHRLAEWRTAAAQAALRARQRDRDPLIAEAALQALEAFPGEWG